MLLRFRRTARSFLFLFSFFCNWINQRCAGPCSMVFIAAWFFDWLTEYVAYISSFDRALVCNHTHAGVPASSELLMRNGTEEEHKPRMRSPQTDRRHRRPDDTRQRRTIWPVNFNVPARADKTVFLLYKGLQKLSMEFDWARFFMNRLKKDIRDNHVGGFACELQTVQINWCRITRRQTTRCLPIVNPI